MAGRKISAVCHSGGEIVTRKDGTLSYKGGFSHAIYIHAQMKFEDFQIMVAEMFDCSDDSMYIYYFLPGSKTDPITISNDKDLKYMIKSHENSVKANIYVFVEKTIALNVPNMLWYYYYYFFQSILQIRKPIIVLLYVNR